MKERGGKGKSGMENYSRFYIFLLEPIKWSRVPFYYCLRAHTERFAYECEEARWKQIPFYYKPAKFMFEKKNRLEFFFSLPIQYFHCIIHDDIRQQQSFSQQQPTMRISDDKLQAWCEVDG